MEQDTATFPDYEPLLPDNFEALGKMTRDALSKEHTACWFALWQYGPPWYASAKRQEMVDHVRYQMRAWAGWLCVLQLDEKQVDLFYLWLVEAAKSQSLSWGARILLEQWDRDASSNVLRYNNTDAYEMARRHFTRRAGFLVYWQFCEEMRLLGRIYPPKLHNVQI